MQIKVTYDGNNRVDAGAGLSRPGDPRQMTGDRGAYLEKLKFTPPRTNAETADPGEVAPLIRHMSE